MSFDTRSYGIVSKADLDRELLAGTIDPHLLFQLVIQSTPDTLRQSLDGAWVVMKADKVEVLDSLGGKTRYQYLIDTADANNIAYVEYTLEDLRTLLSGPEWSEEQ